MASPHPQEERIFAEALELTGEARLRFLEDACAADIDLRPRVDALLQASEEAEDYLETDECDAFAIGKALQQSAPADEMPGDYIGRYRLLERIGEGGWGVVWMAEQKEPVQRRVALKILKLGMDTKEVVARFESERQALAMMDHPGIAKVFDGGVSPNGRPFFVMELVRGFPITEYCDRETLPSRARLHLFTQVCQAVHHAHQKGIIHRDLKPSNILVTVNDGEAVPKVIDFGIAKAVQFKLTDKTLFTRFHSFVGTPVYTSPEQMQMSSLDVDTRSDIYSLGVILYELLSGMQPFDASRLNELGIDGMRKVISEEDPLRPSDLVTSMNEGERANVASSRGLVAERLPKELKGELDWIVMKCLEKNRSRRYETVNALSMDVGRYLNHKPVLAREPTAFYRIKKLIDRNRIAFGVSVALAASLMFGSVAIAWLGLQAIRSERQAQSEARKSAEISEFIKEMYSHVDSLVELQLKGEEGGALLKQTLKETLELAERRLPVVSPEAQVELLDILGSVYFRIGDYEEAQSMFRRELERLATIGDSSVTARARSMNHLGAALGRLEEFEEAEKLIRDALRLHASSVEANLRGEARSLVNLSLILAKKAIVSDLTLSERDAHLNEGVESIERALELQRSYLGDQHEEIAASLNELGFVLSCLGGESLARAETLLDEALKMNRSLLGEINPAVASSLTLLAINQVTQGKYRVALGNYERAREIRRRLKESTATDLISSYGVSVWEHQNTGEETLASLFEVTGLAIQRLEADSIEVADMLAIQAWGYNQEGQFATAEAIAQRCFDIRSDRLPEHWLPYHTRSLIGRALAGQGRYDEAEGYLLDGFEGVFDYREQLGSEHDARIVECLYYLVLLYRDWEKPDELQSWIVKGRDLGFDLSAAIQQ